MRIVTRPNVNSFEDRIGDVLIAATAVKLFAG
jgi:hypothetical protein